MKSWAQWLVLGVIVVMSLMHIVTNLTITNIVARMDTFNSMLNETINSHTRSIAMLGGLPIPQSGRLISSDEMILVPPTPGNKYIGELHLSQQQLKELQERTDKELGGQLRVMIIDPPCLSQMAQALQAIEPWLPQFTYEGNGNWYDHQRVDVNGMEKEQAAVDKFFAVKAQCWGQHATQR